MVIKFADPATTQLKTNVNLYHVCTVSAGASFRTVLQHKTSTLTESVKLLYRNVQRFRGGLVFKAHRPLYHPTLGSRVIKKKKKYRQKSTCCVARVEPLPPWYPGWHETLNPQPSSLNPDPGR